MITETFNIKGMICTRCLKVLNNELRDAGANVVDIQLGKVVINYDPGKIQKATIDHIILDNDFEIIEGDDVLLAEQTKRWIVNYVWNTGLDLKMSKYLSTQLMKNYGLISKNFTTVFGHSIEHYSLLLKMERVKEAIETGKLSFGEIANSVGYQNSSALSKQFKKHTGITMRAYKTLGKSDRKLLDKI